ncbi:thioredoxin TrxC [Sulfurospirillum arcachonense]|uniref:thioredoxin TrxC n=1 Tax=Sulfurospirillum arcachonense TaxID=57666 RepID=UPI00046A9F68|nr:thioredoxin TrxC [Sulfurospirillum arcachonense]
MKIICPKCSAINNVPKKDEYKKANCGNCKESLLINKIITATGDTIDKIIDNSDLPVVIDFWAPWCGPCKSFAPVFGIVCTEFPLKAVFVKINTEQEKFLASRFKIRSIPTLAVFKNTKEVERVSGAMNEESLKSFVQKHL